MQFRTAFPVALLVGSVLGAAATRAGVSDALRPGNPSSLSAALPRLLPLPEVPAAPAEVAARWDIPVVRNAPVQRFVDLFTNKQQDRMALYLKRSGRYEGMIRAKLRAKGMPEDLVYLSMIESGFNPTARSRASAVGLWQFMAGTARDYGLRVDSYVDERKDPEKSTDAALRYLRDLHRQFGSWYLAAAAYNTGENRVARVMRQETGAVKGREQDFWRIRHRLPSETREYVPLMVAAALIGKEPHKYGMGRVERWMPLETDTVAVPGGTDLGVVADAVGVGESELAKLNPHLVKKMTPPGKKDFPVRVPEGRSPRYAANFERVRVAAGAREARERTEASAARRRAAEA
ncbi:MAG TPA: lytic transglycosylase domain-containing protein, partial [Longimicrobium sp.]|nr:lytic transglycosylase domain-containing protein [Longimicrobium sp.]